MLFRLVLESHVVECSIESFMHKVNRPVDWREIFMKQSVGKCKKITSVIFVNNYDRFVLFWIRIIK